MNGQYGLPWSFLWAATFTAQSGALYNRTAQLRDAQNTTVTVNAEYRVGRYNWVSLWDNRSRKDSRSTIGKRSKV